MLTGSSGSPNYRRQRPSETGVEVGRQLAARHAAMQGMQGMGSGPPGAVAPGAPPMNPVVPLADGIKHGPAVKVALAEAVGHALGLSEPSEPRMRSPMQRFQLRKLGLSPTEVALQETIDPALRGS